MSLGEEIELSLLLIGTLGTFLYNFLAMQYLEKKYKKLSNPKTGPWGMWEWELHAFVGRVLAPVSPFSELLVWEQCPGVLGIKTPSSRLS